MHDLSRLEERMLGMEAEKDSLQLQVILGRPFLFPCDPSSATGECVGGPD